MIGSVLACFVAGILQAPAPVQAAETLPSMPRITLASRDCRRLALETLEDGVWVVDIASKRVVLRVPGHERNAQALTWSPDGTALAILGMSGEVEIVDVPSGALRAKLRTPRDDDLRAPLRRMEFAGGGDTLLVAFGSWPAELWSVAGRHRIARLESRAYSGTTAYAVSRDGTRIALGDELWGVSVFDARNGKRLLGPLQLPCTHGFERINALDFDPTASALAIGASDCKVRLLQLADPSDVRELSHCDEDVLGGMEIGCVRFSPDGSRLVSTSYSFWEARIWDVASGRLLGRNDYGGGTPGGMPVEFSSDGRFVTIARQGRVLSAEDGHLVRAFDPNTPAWTWYDLGGDIVWTVRGCWLVVSSVATGETLLEMRIGWQRR